MPVRMTAASLQATQKETPFHILVADYLSIALPPDLEAWTTIAHGAYLGGGTIQRKGKQVPISAIRGERLRRMGMKPGWPDIILLKPHELVQVIDIEGNIHVGKPLLPLVRFIGLELKRPRGGRLSDDQIKAHAIIEAAGGKVYVARTLDEVEWRLRAENIALRVRASRFAS